MVQCKKCKLFLSSTKDEIVVCKGACEGTFHKKCAKRFQKDVCDDCSRRESSPKISIPPKIDLDPKKMSVESLLQELNNKLVVVYDMQTKIQDLTNAVDFYSERYQDLTEFKGKAEKKITELEQKNVFLVKCNQALEERVVALEQRGNEKNVEISGLEQTDGEEIMKVVKKLAIKLGFNPEEIEQAKRVGVERPSDKMQRPRSVIVTLRSTSAKENWLKKRRISICNADIYENNNKQVIYLNEDLTKYKRQLFWSAKSQLKPTFTYVWIQKTNILVKRSESEKKIYQIRREDDIKSLLESAKRSEPK